MENINDGHKPMNSKGAAIFKVMLDEKKAITEHLQNGGEPDDILDVIQQNHDAITEHLKNGGKLEDYKSNLSVLH